MYANKNEVIIMSGIVVYRSKTGYTKRYAELISDQLSFKCKSISDLTESELSQYDMVLFGGSLHASGINNLGDKILMQLLKMKIKIKSEANRTADERGMLAAYSRVIDFVRADKTLPIVRYISTLQNENSNE